MCVTAGGKHQQRGGFTPSRQMAARGGGAEVPARNRVGQRATVCSGASPQRAAAADAAPEADGAVAPGARPAANEAEPE